MFVQIEKNMLAQSDNFQINSMLQDHERALEGPTVGILEMAWIAHRQSPCEIHSHAGLSWFLLSLEKMFFFFIFFLLFFLFLFFFIFVGCLLYFRFFSLLLSFWHPSFMSYFLYALYDRAASPIFIRSKKHLIELFSWNAAIAILVIQRGDVTWFNQ